MILEGPNIGSATLLNYHGREGMHTSAYKAYHPKGTKLEKKARKVFQKLGAKDYGNAK